MEGMTGYVMPLEPLAVGWDIHCHTVFSDGMETLATSAEQPKALGSKGVAIPDHDITADWPEAEAVARRVGSPSPRDTEITATGENVSVHMLDYQYGPTNQHITDLSANTRAARLQRTQRMVELLSRDYPTTWQSVLTQVKEGGKTTIGQPHIADALVSAGVYRTRSEAFADAVSASSKYHTPTPSPTSHEVTAAVKGAGGAILIVHADDVSRNRRLLSDDQIEALISEGLDGLEVQHRDDSPEQRERSFTICHRHQLLAISESGWHGKGKSNKSGENLIDGATVEEIVHHGVLPLYR